MKEKQFIVNLDI